MKKLFMSLLLFIVSNPLLANQITNQSACQQMYHDYQNDYITSRSQILTFLDTCIPALQPQNNQPLHYKLLQIVDDDKKILTLRI